MISMTNSMLCWQPWINSALKISNDKHVGYVLSMFCSLRRPVVKLRLTWPGYHCVTPFQRRLVLVLDFSGWFKSVQNVQMSRSDKLKVELFGSRCEAAVATHDPRAVWEIRFNCKWSPVWDNIVLMEIQLPSYLSDYRGGRFKYRNFKELDNK